MKRLSKFAEILSCYSASKLIHFHGNTKGKYSICAAKLADSFEIPEFFVGTDDIEHMVFERVANIVKAFGII